MPSFDRPTLCRLLRSATLPWAGVDVPSYDGLQDMVNKLASTLLGTVGEGCGVDRKDTIAGAKDPFTHPLAAVLR